MLVMYTLNNSVSSKLPPTSYIKLIDVWLLFGLILPFFIVILLVTIEHMPNSTLNVVRVDSGKSPRSSHNLMVRFSRIYLPVMELIFVFLYASFALFIW